MRGWVGGVLAVIAIGSVVGIFTGSGPVGGQIGAGVVAVLCGVAAWRVWTGPHDAQSPRE
jgi:hypothetical protein